LGGFQMSAQNLVLEFGSRRNLPMRIAVATSAAELVAAFGAFAGGVMASVFSYPVVFWTAIACQAAALGLVVFTVDEPRWRRS
ncbi:MAG: MFS transporter, partial [Myxococcota bacterium]